MEFWLGRDVNFVWTKKNGLRGERKPLFFFGVPKGI
jgi:hypothetical protein